MKKNLLALLLACGAFTANAQIPTITSANNYTIGENHVIYVADTAGISPGSAGANITWDFSHLKRIASRDSFMSSYYAPSSTLYEQDFPNANIATNSTSGNAIAFYNLTNSKMEMLGVVSRVQNVTVKQFYSNPHVMYTLPMTYNYNFSDDFAAKYTANEIDVYRTGNSTVNADAYGTLKIDGKTFMDVLRLHNVSQSRDSVDYEFTSLVTVIDMESWVYMMPGKKDPLLTISHTTATNTTTGQTTRSKSVTFNSSRNLASSVPEKTGAVSSISLYPNPAKENCRVALRCSKDMRADVEVVNHLGQQINVINGYQLKAGENLLNLNLQNMTNGIYFVQVRTNDGLYNQKLIKE